MLPETKGIVIFFAGKGLHHLYENDEKTKISLEKIKSRFDFEISPSIASMGV